MDAKEEGIILGELKGFKEASLRQMDQMQKDIGDIRRKVEALNKWKWKVTGVMASILFLLEGGFQLARVYVSNIKGNPAYEKVISDLRSATSDDGVHRQPKGDEKLPAHP